MITSKVKNYRWIIVVLLFTATVINYMDRQIIGLLKPVLEKEFNWSETDFAYIIMAFTAAYAVGLISFGWLIDKWGTKLGYSISVTVWSIATMIHAAVRTVFGFSLARVGLALGEAGNFPAAMKAVSEWFPKKERALATGIFNSGTSVGVVLALLVTPWILVNYGWHEVFLITGSFGFVWLLFWVFIYKVPQKQKRLTLQEYHYIKEGQDEEDETEQKIDIQWKKLFAFKQTWAFVVGKGLIDPIFWFFLFWLPSYFASAFSLDLTKPSVELMIIYGATTLGSIAGGYISSSLIKRGIPVLKARKIALLFFALLEVSIILAQFTTNVWMAVTLISVAVAVHQAWATNVFTMASDMFPKEVVSSVVGIGGMAGAVGGILFPILVGALLDKYKAIGNLEVGYNILFTVCGFTYLLALTIIHHLTRKNQHVTLNQLK